jgi:hypothetical protein
MGSILGDQGRRSTKDLTKIVIREAAHFEGTGISGEVHKTWGVSSDRRDYRFLARFFIFEISRLDDTFLMEIEKNVNPGTEKRRS